MADNTLREIRANRKRRLTAVTKADTELPGLVLAAFKAGRTWQEVAKALGGLTKQRVYQLRADALKQEEQS